ncbi:MAG: aldehyde dehydrogenase family protein [Deltaproteobacteria bacterium]|nr:aldehyde dehydrogenase family protein [Deltaproteobacteria bacterium]
MTPRLRVEALIIAARRTFGPRRDPSLVRALAAESGLHEANVTWALDHALELSPTEEELETFVRRAPHRTAVLVVLAANVLVAPLRAIAWALAQSDRVFVRPSRRARLFTRALASAVPALGLDVLELSDDPGSDVARAIAALPDGAAVHAYGGRATIDAIAAAAAAQPREIATELHGPGFGAIVDSAEAIVAHAPAIAADVVAFDQAGCLSPRIVIVIESRAAAGGDAHRAAEALHAALSRAGQSIPRRTLDPGESAALARARDAAIFAGRAHEGSEHLVVELQAPTLLPVGRALAVVGVSSVVEAIAALSALGPDLAAVGTSLSLPLPGVRMAALGRMQTPRLDGPVDLRVLGR